MTLKGIILMVFLVWTVYQILGEVVKFAQSLKARRKGKQLTIISYA